MGRAPRELSQWLFAAAAVIQAVLTVVSIATGNDKEARGRHA